MTEPQIRERVLAEVDALADDLVQMTIDTVRIPSVNPTYPGIDQHARPRRAARQAESLATCELRL